MWSTIDYPYVFLHVRTFPGVVAKVYEDKVTGDRDASLEIRTDKVKIDLYDYYPVSEDNDEIVQEMLGAINAVTIE